MTVNDLFPPTHKPSIRTTIMSFLSDLIGTVQSTIRKPNPDVVVAAVRDFQEEITNKLNELHEADNLRIFDRKAGGILRGPKSRAKENNLTGYLLCQEKYLATDNKLEIPYFRAVFNSPTRTLKATPNLKIRLIGYESPLMRKKKKEGESRIISCDLVGLTSDNRILCIEVKVKPNISSTDIVYGLLEGFAYGVCIEYFLSHSAHRSLFIQEVQACVDKFHKAEANFDANNLTAAFSLAAPKEYFAAYFNPTQLMTETKANKRVFEADQLLTAFQKINGPAWAGFLVLEPPCRKDIFEPKGGKMLKYKKYIEPHFRPESVKVELANDIDALKKAVESKGISK